MRVLLTAVLAVLLASGLTGCLGQTEITEDQIPRDVREMQAEKAEKESDVKQIQTASPEALRTAATLMTPEDVEQVTGLKGLEVYRKDPRTGAKGDINISNENGVLLVMMSIGQGDFYEESKQGGNYGRDWEGIGDESYVGPDPKLFPIEVILGVKKDDWGLMLTSFARRGPDGEPEAFLTIDQLEQLAEIALDRIEEQGL